jgi:hypothetical protein
MAATVQVGTIFIKDRPLLLRALLGKRVLFGDLVLTSFTHEHYPGSSDSTYRLELKECESSKLVFR